jgi:hypothetical protein
LAIRRGGQREDSSCESILEMGLDIVELVLECEESFAIKLENSKLERMRTVGDLFELICGQLGLPFGSDSVRPMDVPEILSRRSIVKPKDGWTREAVWKTLVVVVVNQLQVDWNDVRYHTDFQEDLGAD